MRDSCKVESYMKECDKQIHLDQGLVLKSTFRRLILNSPIINTCLFVGNVLGISNHACGKEFKC